MSALYSQDSEYEDWLEQEFERCKRGQIQRTFHDAHSFLSDNCVPDNKNTKINCKQILFYIG